MRPLTATLTPLAAAALLAACATGPTGPDARTATIQRTANGVPHISAPDPETLAYAMAYAYAQDNVCMTADQLVTVRGERARWFGGATPGLLARRMFPNEQIDLFIAAHMDDTALERAWAGASAESQAMARGTVAGYNRYLADQAGKLPAACNSQPWVKPMTLAEFRRQGELTAVQAATAALADAVLGARPPAPTAATSSTAPERVDLAREDGVKAHASSSPACRAASINAPRGAAKPEAIHRLSAAFSPRPSAGPASSGIRSLAAIGRGAAAARAAVPYLIRWPTTTPDGSGPAP